jgi:hypothetical protein
MENATNHSQPRPVNYTQSPLSPHIANAFFVSQKKGKGKIGLSFAPKAVF